MADMNDPPQPKNSARARADRVKDFRCKNLIAVLENPEDIRNIGTVIRNVNALGVEKAYVIDRNGALPDDWQDMREHQRLSKVSASAIKWSYVKTFNDTESCLQHLAKNGFVSVVTSPRTKGRKNVVLHEGDYTRFKKLAVWFGNEATGIRELGVQESALCVNIPMFGIVESLNLGTSTGIVLYEVTKQRRAFQERHKAKRQANARARKRPNPSLKPTRTGRGAGHAGR